MRRHISFQAEEPTERSPGPWYQQFVWLFCRRVGGWTMRLIVNLEDSETQDQPFFLQ